MLRTILNAYKSKGHLISKAASPRHDAKSPRHYTSEATEYVVGIHNGMIAGVDPCVVEECPVCSKILRELYVDKAEAHALDSDHLKSDVDLATKIWVGLWLLHHDGSSHIHDYAFEAES